MRHLQFVAAAAIVAGGGQGSPAQTLDGRIADWPPGQLGQLRVILDSSGIPAARADVAGDGSFRVIFPPLKAMAQLPVIRTPGNGDQAATPFCPDSSSPQGTSLSGVPYSAAHLEVTRPDGDSLGRLGRRSSSASYDRAGLVSSMLLFVSRPVQLHGVLTCPDQEVQLDLDLEAGFTLLAREILMVNHGMVASRFTRSSAVPQAWYLGDTAARTGLIVDAKGDGSGALVTAVTDGSPADLAGIIAGSLILTVDGVDVRRASLSKLFALLVGSQGSRVLVEIMVPGQNTPEVVPLSRL